MKIGLVRQNSQKGNSLIELLLAFGLFAIIAPALLVGVLLSREGKSQQAQLLQAQALVLEGQEAVRSIRESGWSAIESIGTFHPEHTGTAWQLVPGSEQLGEFTRTTEIQAVQRTTNGEIVLTGGNEDPSTRRVITTVSWSQPFPGESVSEQLITRYLDNETYTESTTAEFEAGTQQGVAVVEYADGAVQLGAGGQGDWCKPNEFI